MRIVKFNGNEDECLRWSKKFLAVAKVKKFANIVNGSVTVQKLIDIMDEKDMAIRDLNQAAYCCLLYCMSDNISFSLVDTAKIENLPDGYAAFAWKNLLTRYEPKQYGVLLNLKRDFMTKSLDECEQNPDVLYLELEKIRQKNLNVSDDSIDNNKMIAQIINQMPSVYENKVDHIKHQIDSEVEMTLVEVLGHLRDKYMSLKKENNIDSRTSNNTKALIAKQFKGYCRECGEYGNKKDNCPKLNKDNKYHKNHKKHQKKKITKNLTCYYCGKKGHIEKDCFKRKRDAEQGIVRPISKNIEKEETTKTAYGLITSDIKKDSQMCPYCVNEQHVWKNCYSQPERKFCYIEVVEKKDLNSSSKKDFV